MSGMIMQKNHAALLKYEKNLERAKVKKERVERGVIRATAALIRSREKVRYYQRTIATINECSERGEPFRKPKEKKKRTKNRKIRTEEFTNGDNL